MTVGFLWRGMRRGAVTKQVQPGHEPKRHAVSVSLDTYVALCGIADDYGTSLQAALSMLLGDLPPVKQERAWARPEGV